MGWEPEATQAAPRSSRQSGRFAVLPIVTHTSTPPHIAPFSAPLPTETFRTASLRTAPPRQVSENRPKPCAVARARREKPGAKRRQGKAKRMPRQGGLRVGVGGAV
jgi:hypothetical protein